MTSSIKIQKGEYEIRPSISYDTAIPKLPIVAPLFTGLAGGGLEILDSLPTWTRRLLGYKLTGLEEAELFLNIGSNSKEKPPDDED